MAGVVFVLCYHKPPAVGPLLASRDEFESVPAPLVAGKLLGPRGPSERAEKGAGAREPAPLGATLASPAPAG